MHDYTKPDSEFRTKHEKVQQYQHIECKHGSGVLNVNISDVLVFFRVPHFLIARMFALVLKARGSTYVHKMAVTCPTLNIGKARRRTPNHPPKALAFFKWRAS
jgi:hypothetical protein